MKELFGFQIGDRVEVVDTHYASKEHLGHRGTVCVIDSPVHYGVEFDEQIPPQNGYIRGHSLGGILGTERGWWCVAKDLKLVSDNVCFVDDLL